MKFELLVADGAGASWTKKTLDTRGWSSCTSGASRLCGGSAGYAGDADRGADGAELPGCAQSRGSVRGGRLGGDQARGAVAGKLGVAVLSRHALPADPAAAGIAVLPVEGFPIESQWHIVYPKGRQLSPIATEFERHLLLHARQWSPHARPA